MSTLNISVPAAMKAFVDTQLHSDLYGSPSDDVRTLIHDDQQRRAEAIFEAQLLTAYVAVRVQRLPTR
jgi:Arc/MetJ-type ribon-helix-helix transcriptional regulator